MADAISEIESDKTPAPVVKRKPEGKPDITTDVDDDTWDDKTRSHVKSLRDENKARRLETEALTQKVAALTGSLESITGKVKKVLGDDEDQPNLTADQKIDQLSERLERQAVDNAFLKECMRFGITDEDDQDYFAMLLNKDWQANSSVKDYAMSDESLNKIVERVRSKSSVAPTGTVTSFNQTKIPSPKETPAEITLEKFKKMGTSEKGFLLNKNPDLYNRLHAESKPKRL